MTIERLLQWFGQSVGESYNWRQRYRETNQHNGWFPAISSWLTGCSKSSWITRLYPIKGYRGSVLACSSAYQPDGPDARARKGTRHPGEASWPTSLTPIGSLISGTTRRSTVSLKVAESTNRRTCCKTSLTWAA